MAGTKEQQKAREQARRAQAEFERTIDGARVARRKSFQQAKDAGLSLREIGEAVELHWTTVGEIIKDK
jgi:DNA-directed RNA polymerase specialized sigma24 family protein